MFDRSYYSFRVTIIQKHQAQKRTSVPAEEGEARDRKPIAMNFLLSLAT